MTSRTPDLSLQTKDQDYPELSHYLGRGGCLYLNDLMLI